MKTPEQAFAELVAAARGAIEWHRETGDSMLDVPADYETPNFGSGRAPSAVTQERAQTADLLASLAAAGAQSAPPASVFPKVAPKARADKAPPPAEDNRPSWPTLHVHTTIEGNEMGQRAASLQSLRDQVTSTNRCHSDCGHTELVFGQGHPGARLMFIGDGPGPREDELGLPFVDDAGVLLGKMVRAMGLKRNDVFLSYLVKCYCPSLPVEEQMENWASVVATEIQIIKPEVIVSLGETASRRLTGREEAFPHLRGKWFSFEGIPVLPTFHPHALLQNPASKGQVWTDLKAVMRQLNLQRPGEESTGN